MLFSNIFPYIKNNESFDTETTGLDPYHGDKIFSYSRFDGKKLIVQRIDKKLDYKKYSFPANKRKILQDYMNDYTIVKICHNVKYEISMLLNDNFKIHPLTVFHDTMIMSQMLNNLKKIHNLKSLAFEFANYPRENDIKVKKEYEKLGSYQFINKNLMDAYQTDDAIRGLLLFDIFAPEIIKKNMVTSYLNEIETIKVVQQMEERGFKTNKKGALELINWINNELDKMQKETINIFGRFINPNSESQIKYALYDVLKLPILSFTTTSLGENKYKIKKLLEKGISGKDLIKKYPWLVPQVDKLTLFALQEKGYNDPFLNLIIKYRTYTNSRSTIENYINKFADNNDIVRSNILSNEDTTGRMASRKPNIQNVQKTTTLLNPFAIPARKCWRARQYHYLDLVDQAQIELRLVISICKDPLLTECLNKNEDTHVLLANCWYNEVKIENEAILGKEFKHLLGKYISFNDLDKDSLLRKKLRNASKNANFGLPFGAQPDKISKTLGISIDQVIKNFKIIKEKYYSYFTFAKNQEKFAKQDGFVTTPFGRIIWVDFERPYAAANYIIQSTAAEVLKRGAVRMYRYYLYKFSGINNLNINNKLSFEITPCYSLNKFKNEIPRIIVPIHDELIQEKHRCFLKYDKKILPELSNLLTTFPEINVPLKVEWKRTFTTWDKAREINLNGTWK